MQTIGGNAFCVVSDGAKFDLRYARAAFAALAGYALLGRLEWRMFEPFPGNYVWNLAANLALYSGGNHGKVDVACRRARGGEEQGADGGTGVFFDSFLKVADQVVANAERDLEKGRRLSASAKFRRAAIYYQVAERVQGRDNPRRKDAYRDALRCADRWITLGRLPVEHVDLPYEGKSFPALFWKARSQDGRPAPAVGVRQARMESFMAWAPSMCLDGVVAKITVPFLVTYGSGDRQIPVEYAHRSYEQAVNSSQREVHIFKPHDFAIEHCEIDNGTAQCDYIADWIAENFRTPTAD